MKQVPVGNTFAVVDDEDFERVAAYHWTLHSQGYAVHKYGPRHKRQSLYMHALILGVPNGKKVDHQDGDKLNNCRHNLRPSTHAQNIRNSKLSKANKSGFKGVFWYAKTSRWMASIMFNYKNIHLGYFKEKIDAAKAYDAAARQYFGEFAKLNL